MTYNTASGVPIPQGTDAFNPPAQFRDWADGDDAFNNALNVNLDSERTALAPPKLRDGILCWVRTTKTLWSYQGTTWVILAAPLQSGVVTPAANFTISPTTTQLYRSTDGIVTFAVYAARTTGTTIALNEALVTLPAGFRPDVTDSVVGGGYADGTGGPVAANIRVQPGGTVLYVGPTGKNIVLASVSYKAA